MQVKRQKDTEEEITELRKKPSVEKKEISDLKKEKSIFVDLDQVSLSKDFDFDQVQEEIQTIPVSPQIEPKKV